MLQHLAGKQCRHIQTVLVYTTAAAATFCQLLDRSDNIHPDSSTVCITISRTTAKLCRAYEGYALQQQHTTAVPQAAL